MPKTELLKKIIDIKDTEIIHKAKIIKKIPFLRRTYTHILTTHTLYTHTHSTHINYMHILYTVTHTTQRLHIHEHTCDS